MSPEKGAPDRHIGGRAGCAKSTELNCYRPERGSVRDGRSKGGGWRCVGSIPTGPCAAR
jgi:hypothetical protein